MTAGPLLFALDASQVADVEGTAATAGVLFVLLTVGMRLSPTGAFDSLRAFIRGAGLGLAGGVAVLATLASLWFSEGAHFPPCELCWYQRIAMYPLAIVLPMAALRRDTAIRPYAFALTGIGLAVSAWHNYVETFPERNTGSCDPDNPCTIRWVEGLGFWTIPRMAALSFVLILTLLLIDRPEPEEP